MKEYIVIVYSKMRFSLMFFLFIFSVLPASIFLYRYNILGQILIGIYCIFVIIFPFFILPKYLAKAVINISIDAEGFELDWIKPYWGNKPKLKQRFRLDELKSYKYESSYNFSTLKLRLKSGSKIQLHRWYNDNNDDFNRFMTQFKRTIESYNKKKSTTAVIEKEKSIMENRTFLIAIGLFVGVIFITTILLIFFKGVSNIKGIIHIFIVLAPLIWVTTRIVKGLQKTKTE